MFFKSKEQKEAEKVAKLTKANEKVQESMESKITPIPKPLSNEEAKAKNAEQLEKVFDNAGMDDEALAKVIAELMSKAAEEGKK